MTVIQRLDRIGGTNRECSEEVWRLKERNPPVLALMENRDSAATDQVLTCHSQLTLSAFRMSAMREMMEPLSRLDGPAMAGW